MEIIIAIEWIESIDLCREQTEMDKKSGYESLQLMKKKKKQLNALFILDDKRN